MDTKEKVLQFLKMGCKTEEEAEKMLMDDIKGLKEKMPLISDRMAIAFLYQEICERGTK